MRILPKLFYDAGADGAGAGGANPPAAPAQDDNNGGQQKDIQRPLLSEQELKDYGFDSPEALKTFLQKQKEENVSPEEKEKQANIAKANFLKFSSDQNILKVEEYSQYENIKAKPDQDLVYENFVNEFKADHPEITDPKELETAAKEEFEYEYKQNAAATEAQKKKGLERLSRDAKELRSPIENKVIAAQNQFKEYGSIQQTYPKFEDFVEDAIKRNTPDKLVAYKHKEGENEIEIDIELTKADREAIAKEFKTPKTFQKFLTAKPEELTAAIDKKMQGWLFQNKRDEIMSKGIEVGRGLGTAEGSNIGATNPFPLRKGPNVDAAAVASSLEESNTRMQEQRKKLQHGR